MQFSGYPTITSVTTITTIISATIINTNITTTTTVFFAIKGRLILKCYLVGYSTITITIITTIILATTINTNITIIILSASREKASCEACVSGGEYPCWQEGWGRQRKQVCVGKASG